MTRKLTGHLHEKRIMEKTECTDPSVKLKMCKNMSAALLCLHLNNYTNDQYIQLPLFLECYMQKRNPAVDSILHMPQQVGFCTIFPCTFGWGGCMASKGAIITSNQRVEQWSCINSRQGVCHLQFSTCPTADSPGIVVDIWCGSMALHQMSSKWATEGERQGGAARKESNCIFVDADKSQGFGVQLNKMSVKCIIIYSAAWRQDMQHILRVHSQAAKIRGHNTKTYLHDRALFQSSRTSTEGVTSMAECTQVSLHSYFPHHMSHTLSKGHFKKDNCCLCVIWELKLMYEINVLTDTTVRDSLPCTTRLKVYSPLTESIQRSTQHQDEGPLLMRK